MAQRRNEQPEKEWHFFSFPVAFAFFLGALVATVLFYPLGFIIFVVSLFVVGFCTSHVIARWLRRRTLDRRVQREEEDERERRALAARAAAARGDRAPEGASSGVVRRRRRRRS
jgi:membrane protein implicated in regulation of membrane protease activity